MKKQKWTLSALVSILSLSLVLGGCAQNESNNEGTPTASQEPTKTSEAQAAPTKLEITKVGWGTKLPDAGNDFIKQALDEKLNVDITLTSPASPDDFKSLLNTRIAAGDYPDIMELDSRATLQMLAEKGALLDLTPYLDRLGEVKTMVGDDSFKKGVFDGKTYAIAKTQALMTTSYYIRKDWLEKLKLEVPTTTEELLKVAKAFTEEDPDGNGKKDTFGISGLGWQAFAPVFGSLGVPSLDMATGVYIKDGKSITSPQDPNMKAALAEVKKFFDAGVVDPEIFSNKGTAASDKGIKGQVGIVFIDWGAFIRKEGAENVKAANPNAEWIMVPTIKGPAGQIEGPYDVGSTSGLIALSRTLEKDEEKLQKIFDLLNYVSSPEGSQLVQYGIKDKHFTTEGSKVKISELGAAEAGYIWLYQLTGRPESEYLATKFDYAAPIIDQASKLSRLNLYNGFIDLPSDFNAADAYRYIGDLSMEIVYGKKSIDSFDSLAGDLNSKFNYQVFMDQASKQMKELGFIQ
ncbi:extracellular solute-binding protein [Paenibacillus sinopodophylli]|uniref:extracellular solute-binding protein n=1 Tax=Paenibacillus sinopodophylli TaxID=1837342 RepID=UPI00110CA188|nr:extracellular solute-binding protein [Paenibacillus sinopodophylli]